MKKITIAIASVLSVFLLASCGGTASSSSSSKEASSVKPSSVVSSEAASPASTSGADSATASSVAAEKTFTVEELAKFDGKNGNPAYVAVDGVVYDVSNVPQWKDGEHNGMKAGNDLTEQIKSQSPHGTSVLKELPVVGKLA